MTYAKSFHQIAREGNSKSVPNDYQVENLKMSLDAAQFAIQADQQNKTNAVSILLTLTFALFGVVISAMSMVQYSSEKQKATIVPSEGLVYFTRWAAENPVSLGAVSAVIILILLAAFGVIRPTKFRWYQDLQRLFQRSERWKFLTLSAVFGLLLFIAGIAILLT